MIVRDEATSKQTGSWSRALRRWEESRSKRGTHPSPNLHRPCPLDAQPKGIDRNWKLVVAVEHVKNDRGGRETNDCTGRRQSPRRNGLTLQEGRLRGSARYDRDEHGAQGNPQENRPLHGQVALVRLCVWTYALCLVSCRRLDVEQGRSGYGRRE